MIAREHFDAATERFIDQPGVVAGRLMSSQGLKVKGKIFAILVDDRLVVKLPRPRVVELVEAGTARPFETAPGRVMKEWATFGTDDVAAWTDLVDESYAYVTSLIR